MVVCRFFQQGYCRYGQNCRFDHIYGSKYTYTANNAPQAAAAPAQTPGYTDEQLVQQVQADMQSALRGGQWILSCYSPYKEKPIFPGIHDLSPEEARLFIYEAKNKNNMEEAVMYMNNLFKETRQKYEQLLQPNIEIIKVLRSLNRGETPGSPFTSTAQNTMSTSNNAASSIFRSAVQNTQSNTQSSIFGSSNQSASQSVFGSIPSQSASQSVFGSTHQATPQSVFGSAPNQPTSQSVFGSAPNQNTSPFGVSQSTLSSPNNAASSIFRSAMQGTSPQSNPSNLFSAANQSIFGAPGNQNTSPFGAPPAQANSPFGPPPNQNSSPFGAAPTQNNSPFGQVQNNSPFEQTAKQNTSPFGQVANSSPFGQTQNSSPFGQSSVFGQPSNQVSASNDPSVYSKMEDLSEIDLEAFKSDHFELGFIPELPPPQQLCTRAS